MNGLVVPFGEVQHGLRGSLGRLEEALPGGVLPQVGDDTGVAVGEALQELLARGGLMLELHVVVEGAFFVALRRVAKGIKNGEKCYSEGSKIKWK